MHELATELIKKNITEVIESWDYEKRKKENLKKCFLYALNKKCHNIDGQFNCFFCLCPMYDMNIKEGRCKINSPDAKYIDNHEGKILDCSDCDFPHKKENAIKLLEGLFI